MLSSKGRKHRGTTLIQVIKLQALKAFNRATRINLLKIQSISSKATFNITYAKPPYSPRAALSFA